MRKVIRALLVATTFGYCFCSGHHQCPAVRTQCSGRFGLNGVFTLRVVGTAVEESEPSAPLGHKPRFAQRTKDTCRVLFFQLGVFLYVFAFRIVSAGNEAAELAVALHKLAGLALGAKFAGFFRPLKLLAVNGARAFALRKSSTAQKSSGFPEFDNHVAVADGAFEFLRRVPEVCRFFHFFF